MQVDSVEKRFAHHHNAFGFLRLFFASLVILSHTPEIVNGSRDHEILTYLFGTISFGEFAVMGFFIISGYLITSSYTAGSDWVNYLRKRVIRIYPAFLAAFIICIFVVAPVGGASLNFDGTTATRTLLEAVFLHQPSLTGAFAGSNYPLLNGAMWTIAYEFRCYLLVILLGVTGILRHPRLVLGLTAAMIALSIMLPLHSLAEAAGATAVATNPSPHPTIFGAMGAEEFFLGIKRQSFRLMAGFLVGMTFYLYRDKVRIGWLHCVIATVLLCICLAIPRLANPGTAVFLAIIVFGVAKGSGHTILGRINNENDISYGVYLYAWPITKLLLWFWPGIGSLAAGLLTFALSCACGWLSWHLIERPALRLLGKKRAIARPAPN